MTTATRLYDAIAELAGFNDDPDAGGITREVYTPEIDPAGVHALVELHVEQGVVLEQGGESIGVVEAIAAPHDFRSTLRGVATHAGATPMRLRRDALAGAAEAMTALERIAGDSRSGTTVCTVGVLRVRPGAINVVPGVPIGMIFVPSAGGISHHPDEYTAPADLENGVRVPAATLARRAG